jgi:hypothetical protein
MKRKKAVKRNAIAVRLTDKELEALDRVRGKLSVTRYLRKLILADVTRP